MVLLESTTDAAPVAGPLELTSPGLHVSPHDVHVVPAGSRSILFHVPTTSLFALDDVGTAVLEALRAAPGTEESALTADLASNHPAAAVSGAVREFVALGVIDDGRTQPTATLVPGLETPALRSVVLNVNTGCNLSCTYCYKADLAAPSAGQRMDFDTAARGVDLLLRDAAPRERLTVVFFGGEPLTNLPLIRQIVDYATRAGAAAGRQIDFSLTTNATLLSEDVIAYLDARRFGITVSMDGPKVIHDRHRRTVGGHGTYDVVAANVRRLLTRYRSRPVGARVTLTAGSTDVVGIFRHLKHELGFFEVGVAPATSGSDAAFNLGDQELRDVFAGMKQLGADYLHAALQGENTGFSNMHQLMTDLAQGTHKVLPCGAGVGLIAVDHAGDVHLCHRFTGTDLPAIGDVMHGVDRARLRTFVSRAVDFRGRPCATCTVRHLCAGGCYHESYARYGNPLAPVHHYCERMRDWVDFGVSVYAQILDGNPDFFRQHIEPRRPPVS